MVKYNIMKTLHCEKIFSFFGQIVDENDPRNTAALLALLTLYAIAHGMMILTNGVFWDDWHHIFNTSEMWISHYMYKGQPLYVLLNKLGRSAAESQYFTRFLSFVFMGAHSILFYLILRKTEVMRKLDAFFAAALLAVFPQYFSRMCLIIFPYTTTLVLFTLSSYLLISGFHCKSVLHRLFVLALFFLTFTLGSMIWFYIVPYCYLYLASKKRPWQSLRASFTFLAEHLDFTLLPFFYYFLAQNFFPPHGFYPEYNKIHTEDFRHIPRLLWTSFNVGLTNVVRESLRIKYWTIVVFLVLSSIIHNFYIGWSWNFSQMKQSAMGFACSVFLIGFAVFPYAAAGKSIEYYYVGDRNSLLALFGCALTLYYLFALLFSLARSDIFRSVAISLCLACFMTTNLTTYHGFLRAAIKQDSMIAWFHDLPELRDGRTFRFRDFTTHYVAKYTPYEQSQLTGLLRVVFKKPERCAAQNPDECSTLTDPHFRWRTDYCMVDYKPEKDKYLVTMAYGPERLSIWNTFRMTFLKIITPQIYSDKIKNVLTLSAEPLVRVLN
jgi:hypothetical protein